LPWSFSCTAEFAFSTVQENKKEMKLNQTYQIMVYTHDINLLG